MQSVVMKKVYFLLILVVCTAAVRAQNVGIGTVTPGAKLDIIGNIKITDQSQGDGKVLTSDNNGLAGWATPAAACFSFATDQSVINNDYLGIGSNSSVFIRNPLVLPVNCILTGMVVSLRGAFVGSPVTATVFKQSGALGSSPVATVLSVTIPPFIGFATGTAAIAISTGDLISIKISSNQSLVDGVAVTVTYK